MKIQYLLIFLFSFNVYSQVIWKKYDINNSPLLSDFTKEIKEDNDGYLWIATKVGLVKFDKNNIWEIFTENNTNMYDHNISTILPMGNNTCWFGHIGGVSYFDGVSFTHYDFDNMFGIYYQGLNTIHQIDVDWNGNIWFATSNGLVKYDGINFIRITTADGLFSNMIWSVKCDYAKQKIWIGTYDEGLMSFNGTNFERYLLYDTAGPFASLQQVNEIFIDDEGDIWLTGYGIFEFDKDSMGIKSYYVNEIDEGLFWGINIDDNNKLWIGSDYLHGLFMYDNVNWFTYDSTNSIIPNHCRGCLPSEPSNHIESIHVDKDNNKWMTTWNCIVVHNEFGITGIADSEIIKNIEIKIYPNPASKVLNIQSSEKDKDFWFRLINSEGKLVTSSKKQTIDVSALQKGNYFIQMFIQDKYIKTEKIVLN